MNEDIIENKDMKENQEWLEEQQHFKNCKQIIQENIVTYENDYKIRHQESIELFQAMQSGDVELYNNLMTSKSLEEHSENQLTKNCAAYEKPYFGRIDFKDFDFDKEEVIYIGKNGVFRNRTEIVIADWRAPVSSIYYENEIGKGEYKTTAIEEIKVEIDLHLKRTYDVAEGQLQGYYDSDVASNDELLIQYLSKNKDAILGEIIATIQKEQNEIIRESPFVNQIVQGVAGSGKTTVAIHRISYILYNYKDRFESNEFCVVGGNDLLLNYITSGLPELDVYNIKKMRMDQLLVHLLGKEWKKKNKIEELFSDAKYRCHIEFLRELELFLLHKKEEYVDRRGLIDREIGKLLTKTGNDTLFTDYPEFSVVKLLLLMDDRVLSRIKSLSGQVDRDLLQIKLKKYRNYYKNKIPKTSIYSLYSEFLMQYLIQKGITAEDHWNAINKGCYDIYDVAALVLIFYRIFQKQEDEEFGQLFIDEAQDFGSGPYYVLKTVLPKCYFTIMGDVSQNINYDTGMNEWEELRKWVLTSEKDQFKLLSKSYRNTIEISEYAGNILKKASLGRYQITPVIRHGIPVTELQFWSEVELATKTLSIIEDSKERGYLSIAIICKNEKEAEKVTLMLSKRIKMESDQSDQYSNRVMILPVRMTKGLEFDTVILWNPNINLGSINPEQAKLLYVAVTRALHELYVLTC